MSGDNHEGLVEQFQNARSQKQLRHLVGNRQTVDGDLVRKLRAEADRHEYSDPQRALRSAEAALYVSSVLDDPASRASSTWAKANALRALGKYRQSVLLYDQAARAYLEVGMPVESARTRIGKVAVLMYQSRYDEALAVAAEARDVLLCYGEALEAAKLDLNTGNVYHRMDRYPEALRLYDRARAAFLELGIDTFMAPLDVNRANVFTLLNSFREAEVAYLRARETSVEAGLKSTVAMIDANIGFLYLTQGHYNKALERLNLARSCFEDLKVPGNVAVVDLDLADLYLLLNLPHEAVRLSERAQVTCARVGMSLERARAMASQAFGHIQLGQHDIAAHLLAEARQAFRREGNQVWVATLDLHRAALLAQDSASDADLSEALTLSEGARQIFRRRGMVAKHAYSQLVEGRLRERMGMTLEAARLYRSALRAASRLRLPWLLYQSQHALGRLEGRDSPQAARRRYLLAIDAIESMWCDLQPEELRTAFLTNRLQAYEDLILLSLESGPSGVQEAFQYVERAKSRALVDLLAGRLEARVKDRGNEKLIARLVALREELNWLYNKLSDGEAPAGQRSQDWVIEMASQVEEREVQLSQILRQLQMRGDEYASLQRAHGSSLEAVQNLLDDGTTLVEYCSAGGELFAFVINRQGAWVERGLCSPSEAVSMAERLRFQLDKFSYAPAYLAAHTAQLYTAVNAHLQRLYDALIRPLRALLGRQRLIIVPHGALHCLPFHAFHDGQRYLVEDFEVSYSPSATVLGLCQERSAHLPSRALIIGVADERAPLVADEVRQLGVLFDSPTLLMGEKATAQALRRHAPQCDIVHIASHGVFSPTNPMFSRFHLADAWLTVHDVYNMELNASLVTLSACETGLNRVVAGDELIGLARGFFYAGAASLLLSLWLVNDQSTARLMQGFYRRLLAGQNKAAALRAAQLELKEEYAHPYYWAPFVLLGRSN